MRCTVELFHCPHIAFPPFSRNIFFKRMCKNLHEKKTITKKTKSKQTDNLTREGSFFHVLLQSNNKPR